MTQKISLPAILIVLFISSCVIASLSTITQSFIAFILCLGLCVLNWKFAQKKIKNLINANLFILFIWIITPFTTKGQILMEWHFLKISKEGIYLCALITLKAEAILLLIISFLSDKNMFDIGVALAKLKCSSKLIWLFMLMERNVHLLKLEWYKLLEAIKLRAFQPHTNMRTYKVYSIILGLLFIHALEKSQAKYEAMLLSGYNGKLPFDKHWHPTKTDYIAIGVAIFVCIFIISFNYVI